MFRFFFSVFLILFLLGNAGAEKPRSIKAINEPLPNVLQKITESSGIQFKVSDALIEKRISAKIQESTWDAVVLTLLDNFNLVEVRDGKGDLIKVHVKKSEIVLDINQLRELAKGPFRSALPAHMLHDTELRKFLSLHGISSSEEMTNIQKTMRVRVAARRQLKMLQKKRLPRLFSSYTVPPTMKLTSRQPATLFTLQRIKSEKPAARV